MPKGFACLSPEARKAMGRIGGLASAARPNAYRWSSKKASEAAAISHAKGAAHKFTPEKAREAGRKGGRARWAKHRALAAAAVISNPVSVQ